MRNVVFSLAGVFVLLVSLSSQTDLFASEGSIPDGALIRASGDVDVYVVKYVQDKKFKRLILSPGVFNNYGHLRWEDVREVTPATRDNFTTSSFVRSVGDVRVFILYPNGDIGEKRWVPSSEIFTAYGFDWDAIYEINSFDRDSYSMGNDCSLGTGPEYCWDPKNCETPDCKH